MIGQYTQNELLNMDGIVSSVKAFDNGLLIRQNGITINYYRKENDGTWTNYNCRTIY